MGNRLWVGPSLLLGACTGTLQLPSGGGGGSSTSQDPAATAPSNLSLSISPAGFSAAATYQATTFATQSQILTAVNDSLTVQNSPLTPTGTGVASTGQTGDPQSAPSVGAPAHSAQSLWASDPAESFSLLLDGDFMTSSHPLCTFLAPLSSLSCQPKTSSTLSLTDWAGALAVQARAKTLEHPELSATSNALNLEHFVFETVSNTTGDATLNDQPSVLAPGGDRLYFVSANASQKNKLYSFDGTTVTRLSNISGSESTVDDIHSLNPTAYYHSHFYFVAELASSYDLYWTDGTQLHRVTSGLSGVYIAGVFNDKLYFVAEGLGGATQLKLYRTDESTIEQVTDTDGSSQPDFSYSSGCSLSLCTYLISNAILNDGANLYLNLFNGNGTGGSLYRLTTGDSLERLTDSTSLVDGRGVLVHNPDRIFVDGFQSGVAGLLVYNGTNVTRLSSNANYLLQDLLPGGSGVYTVANMSATANHLYSSDGTGYDLAGVTSGSNSSTSAAQLLGELDGWFYFTGLDSAAHRKIFRRNSTTVEQFADLNPGADDSPSKNFVVLGDSAYLILKNSSAKNKLFRIHQDRLEQVSNFNGDSADDILPVTKNRTNLVTLGDYAYFTGYNSNGKTKLMRFRYR